MARARRRRIEECPGRPGRYRIDLGDSAPRRFLFTFNGVPLSSRELAEAVAAYVEAQVARGRLLEDVLAEISPNGGSASGIQQLLERWVESFRKKVDVEKR